MKFMFLQFNLIRQFPTDLATASTNDLVAPHSKHSSVTLPICVNAVACSQSTKPSRASAHTSQHFHTRNVSAKSTRSSSQFPTSVFSTICSKRTRMATRPGSTGSNAMCRKSRRKSSICEVTRKLCKNYFLCRQSSDQSCRTQSIMRAAVFWTFYEKISTSRKFSKNSFCGRTRSDILSH